MSGLDAYIRRMEAVDVRSAAQDKIQERLDGQLADMGALGLRIVQGASRKLTTDFRALLKYSGLVDKDATDVPLDEDVTRLILSTLYTKSPTDMGDDDEGVLLDTVEARKLYTIVLALLSSLETTELDIFDTKTDTPQESTTPCPTSDDTKAPPSVSLLSRRKAVPKREKQEKKVIPSVPTPTASSDSDPTDDGESYYNMRVKNKHIEEMFVDPSETDVVVPSPISHKHRKIIPHPFWTNSTVMVRMDYSFMISAIARFASRTMRLRSPCEQSYEYKLEVLKNKAECAMTESYLKDSYPSVFRGLVKPATDKDNEIISIMTKVIEGNIGSPTKQSFKLSNAGFGTLTDQEITNKYYDTMPDMFLKDPYYRLMVQLSFYSEISPTLIVNGSFPWYINDLSLMHTDVTKPAEKEQAEAKEQQAAVIQNAKKVKAEKPRAKEQIKKGTPKLQAKAKVNKAKDTAAKVSPASPRSGRKKSEKKKALEEKKLHLKFNKILYIKLIRLPNINEDKQQQKNGRSNSTKTGKPKRTGAIKKEDNECISDPEQNPSQTEDTDEDFELTIIFRKPVKAFPEGLECIYKHENEIFAQEQTKATTTKNENKNSENEPHSKRIGLPESSFIELQNINTSIFNGDIKGNVDMKPITDSLTANEFVTPLILNTIPLNNALQLMKFYVSNIDHVHRVSYCRSFSISFIDIINILAIDTKYFINELMSNTQDDPRINKYLMKLYNSKNLLFNVFKYAYKAHKNNVTMPTFIDRVLKYKEAAKAYVIQESVDYCLKKFNEEIVAEMRESNGKQSPDKKDMFMTNESNTDVDVEEKDDYPNKLFLSLDLLQTVDIFGMADDLEIDFASDFKCSDLLALTKATLPNNWPHEKGPVSEEIKEDAKQAFITRVSPAATKAKVSLEMTRGARPPLETLVPKDMKVILLDKDDFDNVDNKVVDKFSEYERFYYPDHNSWGAQHKCRYNSFVDVNAEFRPDDLLRTDYMDTLPCKTDVELTRSYLALFSPKTLLSDARKQMEKLKEDLHKFNSSERYRMYEALLSGNVGLPWAHLQENMQDAPAGPLREWVNAAWEARSDMKTRQRTDLLSCFGAFNYNFDRALQIVEQKTRETSPDTDETGAV